MESRSDNLQFLQQVLANLDGCRKNLESIQETLQQNEQLLKEHGPLDHEGLDEEEKALVERISMRYQELIAWAENEKVDVSREIGRLTRMEGMAKSYVSGEELPPELELYY